MSEDNAPAEAALSFSHGLRYLDQTIEIGNCLFDNVVYQMWPNASKQKQRVQSASLRQQINEHMSRHPDDFKPFFRESGELQKGNGLERYFYADWNDYLVGLSQDNVWVDELAIKAVAQVLNRPLVKLCPLQQQKPAQIYNREARQEPLFIAHLHGNHFASLRPTAGQTLQEIFVELAT